MDANLLEISDGKLYSSNDMAKVSYQSYQHEVPADILSDSV